MKFNKKNNENMKPEQENNAAEEMEELDVETMSQFSGAGNPFEKTARVPLQEYTEDQRKKI